MPSPVGHALGGLIVGLALSPAPGDDAQSRWLRALRIPRGAGPLLILCIVAACVPDVDFGWGRHNMETHSVGFALLLGAAVLAWKRSPRTALAVTVAAATHVLFDWLGSDDSPPLGVMALWPFSSAFYFADAYVFEAISRRYWLPGFIAHNLLAVVREVAILGPIAAIGIFLRQRTPPR